MLGIGHQEVWLKVRYDEELEVKFSSSGLLAQKN